MFIIAYTYVVIKKNSSKINVFEVIFCFYGFSVANLDADAYASSDSVARSAEAAGMSIDDVIFATTVQIGLRNNMFSSHEGVIERSALFS